MWPLQSAFSFPLPSTVFLLNVDIRLGGPGFTSLSAGLPRWSFLVLLPLSSSSARDLQHRTCLRLRCCLLEVGLQYVLDLAASHDPGRLCLPLHLWSDGSATLKLFENTSARSFQGVRISPGTSLSCRTRDADSASFLFLKSHAPCATERLCLVPEAVTQSCWRDGIDPRSSSLFHDLAVLFDRIAVRRIAIFVLDLDIAYVQKLFKKKKNVKHVNNVAT